MYNVKSNKDKKVSFFFFFLINNDADIYWAFIIIPDIYWKLFNVASYLTTLQDYKLWNISCVENSTFV